MALEQPTAFLQKYKPPIIIDEFQYAPNLLPYIKAQVDKSGKCGNFWLTGSQSFISMKNVSESLAGRVGIVHLYSLSRSEITGALFDEYNTAYGFLLSRLDLAKPINGEELFACILRGGMPGLFEKKTYDIE